MHERFGDLRDRADAAVARNGAGSDFGPVKDAYAARHSDLNPDFIFAYPAYNMRSTELNAVIGRSQLGRLDENNRLRTRNLKLFLDNLDPSKYQTDFATEGSSNYAFTLVLAEPNLALCQNVMHALKEQGVEFRRGSPAGATRCGNRICESSSGPMPGRPSRMSITFIFTGSISATTRGWSLRKSCNCANC